MYISQITNPIQTFQSKIVDMMVILGSKGVQQTSKILEKPCSEDCVLLGQQFYLSHLRTKLVQKGYLSQQIPKQEDLQDQQKIQKFNKIGIQQDEQNRQFEIAEKIPKNYQKQRFVKKGSKAHQKLVKIKKQQAQRKILNDKFYEDLQIVFSTQLKQKLQTQYSLTQKTLEVKLSIFFYMRWFIDENYIKQKINKEDIFQSISILIKIIGKFENYKGKKHLLHSLKSVNFENEEIQISKTLILDLKICMLYLIKQYEYSNYQIVFNYPRILYYNIYSKYFPCFDAKPYPTQYQLIQTIRESINKTNGEISKPQFILYNTMVGTGKTSIIFSIVAMIEKYNNNFGKKGKNQLKIVYACQIQSVKSDLARLCYNKDIKFAFIKNKTIKRGEKVYTYHQLKKISKTKKYQQQFSLIITDWSTAYGLLTKNEYTQSEIQIFEKQYANIKKGYFQLAALQRENTILFIDEPTFRCNQKACQKIYKILSQTPPKTVILASATMPSKQMIPKTIQIFSMYYPNRTAQQIKSKEIKIGCEVKNFCGKVYYPHVGVQNKLQLQNVIDKIEQIPFFMRMYTGITLNLLTKQMNYFGIKFFQGFDYKGYTENIVNQNVCKIAVKMLKNLLNYDDSLIKQVCNSQINFSQKFQQKQQQQSSQDQIFQFKIHKKQPTKQKSELSDKINFEKILKKDAYKFLGGCLICTADPLAFVQQYFLKWVEKIPSIKSLLRSMRMNQDQDAYFPQYKRVNSLQHYTKYYFKRTDQKPSNQQYRLHKSKLIQRVTVQQVQQLVQCQVEKFLIKLLLCGIGIYAQPRQGLPIQYLQKVQCLASLNKLAFIVSDKSLCFGVNFPISHVIICDNIAHQLTLNQIFQLIGRAGRVGRSWIANIYIQNNLENRLIQFMLGQQMKTGNEQQIFEQMAQQCLDNFKPALKTKLTEISYLEEEQDRKIQLTIKNKFQEQQQKQASPDSKNQKIIIFNKNQVMQSSKKICIKNIKILMRKFLTKNQQNSKQIVQQNPVYQQKNLLPIEHLLQQDILGKTNMQSQINQISNTLQNEKIMKKYYINQQQFINKIIQNASRRILKKYLNVDEKRYPFQVQNKISINNINYPQQQESQYNKYYCKQKQTFLVIISIIQNAQSYNQVHQHNIHQQLLQLF